MAIHPHGGTLTPCLATPARAAALAREAASLPRITLSAKQSCDLELLANGGYSPLDAFMGEDDFKGLWNSL